MFKLNAYTMQGCRKQTEKWGGHNVRIMDYLLKIVDILLAILQAHERIIKIILVVTWLGLAARVSAQAVFAMVQVAWVGAQASFAMVQVAWVGAQAGFATVSSLGQ